MRVTTNGIEVEVEDSGGGGPVVLLIMGLGMQLIAWPAAFVQGLIDAGYRVIRHDNRDVGKSQHFDELGRPSWGWTLLKLRLGLRVTPKYQVSDMAADALGVLDALRVPRAHVVGASMGAMIGQWVAATAPDRVLSFTSIMSSSGARGLPPARREVTRQLMSRPPSFDREAVVRHGVKLWRTIGSPDFESTEEHLRLLVGDAFDRAFHPVGVERQMFAIVADTKRAAALEKISARTLVVHGREDPLIPWQHGEDTARRIRGSRFEVIEGMGHDLAPGVVERLLPLLLDHLGADGAAAQAAQRASA